MADQIVYKGDYGFPVELEFIRDGKAVSLVGASQMRMIFVTPGGGRFEKDATFSTNGTDGKIRYVIEENFLRHSGTWKVQGYVVMPSERFTSEPSEFEVRPVL